MAIKRGKGQWLIPLEELRDNQRIDVDRSDRLTPDQIYERRWALTVLEQVLARPQSGAFAFATTNWSVVLSAQGESPAAEAALEKLCRAYWRPIYSFLRLQNVRPEDAEDLRK